MKTPLDLPEWNQNNPVPTPSPTTATADAPRQAKKPTLSHQSSSSTSTRPPVPKTRWKPESSSSSKLNSASAPIDLSLADDEYGRAGSRGSFGGEPGSPLLERDKMRRSVGLGMGSPIENADLLYEYFPLSVDDWYVYLPFSSLRKYLQVPFESLRWETSKGHRLTLTIGCHLSTRSIDRMLCTTRSFRQI